MYFEINLPTQAPQHIYDMAERRCITDMLGIVHERMERLESALLLSGMRGEQFAAGAKLLFDQADTNGRPVIDHMTADEISENVKLLAENISVVSRLEWPNAIVLVDTAFLTNTEWETIRKIGIGGSDAAALMGLSPYRTAQECYHDKIATQYVINKPDKGQEFIFSYGHKLEPLVIEEFCRRTGAVQIPETRMFAKRDMPYITANIDGILKLPSDELVIFEAKTTTNFNRSAWEDGHVPVQYMPQCRQYLAVLDDPRITRAFIGCIYGNTPADWACSCVLREKEPEEELLEAETEFWTDYVLTNTEPDPSGDPDKDIEIIRRQSGYADKNLPAMELATKDKRIIETYIELEAERKALSAKIDGIKSRQAQLSIDIIKELGNTVKGQLARDDETIYEVSYSPRSFTSVDKDKLKLMYPDAYNECVTTNPENSRVFSVKVKRRRKAA